MGRGGVGSRAEGEIDVLEEKTLVGGEQADAAERPLCEEALEVGRTLQMAFEVEAHSEGIFDFGQAVQVGLFDGDIDIGVVAARQVGHHIARSLEERIVSREIDYGICAPHPRLEVEAIEGILVVAQLLNVSFRHEIGADGRYGKPTSGSTQTTGEGREWLPFKEVAEGEARELEHRLVAFAVEPYGSATGELSVTEIDAELCAIVVVLEI